jgi:hypothetical protein
MVGLSTGHQAPVFPMSHLRFGPGNYAFSCLLFDYLFLFFSRPLDDNFRRINPTGLDEAFKKYEITLPCCACQTQEPDPNVRHLMRIWAVSTNEAVNFGKVVIACKYFLRGDGCRIFGMHFYLVFSSYLNLCLAQSPP